jgi:hypothetical protein
MKLITKLAIILLISVIPLNILAQEKKNLIKTSLVFPLGKIFDVSYERALNHEMSILLEAAIGESFFISPQFRYYLLEGRAAPDGSYISPFAIIGELVDTGAGILVGHQKVFKNTISLEANIGPMVTTDGVTVWGGINLGFAF